MSAGAGRGFIVMIAAFTLLSWLGEYLHNRAELPQLSLFSPENFLMLLVAVCLFVLWVVLPNSLVPAILLLALATLHLVGGALISVLPLPILPFQPEQSIGHYLAHAMYGLAQVPLIVAIVWQIRRSRRLRSQAAMPATGGSSSPP